MTRMMKSSFHKELQTRFCGKRPWVSIISIVDGMMKGESVRNTAFARGTRSGRCKRK